MSRSQRHFINPNHRPPPSLPAFHESRDHAKLLTSSVILFLLARFSLGRPSPSPTLPLPSALPLLAGPARCSCGYFLLLDQSQASPGRFSYFYLPFLSEWFSWFFPIVAFPEILRRISCISPLCGPFLDTRAECDNFQGFRADTAGCMTPSPLFLFSDVPSWVDRRRSLQHNLPANKEEETCWSRVRPRKHTTASRG